MSFIKRRGVGPRARIRSSSTSTSWKKEVTSQRGSSRSPSRWRCAPRSARFAERAHRRHIGPGLADASAPSVTLLLATIMHPLEIDSHDHTTGPATAPITLLEYGDFGCPFCVSAFPVLEAIRSAHATSLRLVFRH